MLKNIFRRLFIGCLMISVSWVQAQDRQKQTQGQKLIREAKMDSAKGGRKSDLFETHLLMGVFLANQNAPEAEVKAAFAEAIKIDPKRKLESGFRSPVLAETFIRRPQFAEIFREVRDQLVGCIYVTSEPSTVDILGVQGDSIVFREITPSLLCDLLTSSYEIVLTKPGFEKHKMKVELKPAHVDTLFVTLKPLLTVESKPGRKDTSPGTFQKTQGSKGWRWVWSGVAVGGAIAVAAIVLSPPDRGNGKNTIADLPVPPDRP